MKKSILKYQFKYKSKWRWIFFAFAWALLSGFIYGQERPLFDKQFLIEKESKAHKKIINAKSPTSQSPPVIDVTYYKLDLDFSGSFGSIQGAVTINAKSLTGDSTAISLDLNDKLIVDSVLIDGSSVPFSQSLMKLFLQPRRYSIDQAITIKIYYHGFPAVNRSQEDSFDANLLSDNSQWIWTLSEPYGARDWFPCIDHPSDKADSADIWITCASNLKAGSEGLLINTIDNGNNTKTYFWKHRYPISSYLISVTIGPFEEFSDYFKYSETDSMQILNYVLPSSLSNSYFNIRNNCAKTPAMLQVFSDIFGLYPFIKEKYGHCEFEPNGGMEHQTMSSIGKQAFDEETLSHELAHQWFGDLITCNSWSNLWLNEGFAEYATALYYERRYGENNYHSYIQRLLNYAKQSTGSLFINDTTNIDRLFNFNLVYCKGAIVLFMLRSVLGDSTFFQAIKTYASDQRFMYKTASTEDFKNVCETVSGKELDYFFNQWIYGESFPQYSYSWTAVPNGSDSRITLDLFQDTKTTNPSFFILPLEIRIIGDGLDTVIQVHNNAKEQQFIFDVKGVPTSITIDPYAKILLTSRREDPLAEITCLKQNYPNPFNPATTISYRIQTRSYVRIDIYNTLGQIVAALVDNFREAGEYFVQWDASKMPSGVYYCRMTATNKYLSSVFTDTKRMLYVR